MVGMEIVWRLYGDSVETDTFYGDFMVKLLWRLSEVFHGENMVSQITRQSTYYLHNFYILRKQNSFPEIIQKLLVTTHSIYLSQSYTCIPRSIQNVLLLI